MPDRDAKHLHLGSWKLRLPASRIARMAIGIALVAGGILGWLPLLGFWMIPIGLLVLSYDIPMIARGRDRLGDWWERRRAKRRK